MNLVRTTHGLAVQIPGQEQLLLRQLIGIGMNYAAHAKEQGKGAPERPVIFTKNPLSACLTGDEIVIPRICQDREQVDYEAELAVILKHPHDKPLRDIPKADALSCVLGYTCANDVSARWWQKDGAGGQFCRGKSFDTFCPLGPQVVPSAQHEKARARDVVRSGIYDASSQTELIEDPQSLCLVCRLNGQTVQDAPTNDMIFDVATLIAECSRGTTLLPGTVILTGTPNGVGMARTPQIFLKHGDVVEIFIPGIGVLKNKVRAEQEAEHSRATNRLPT